MKIYLQKNVYEEALDRIRFIYDEFENVICNFSGGKDSTVCMELCLIVAREKNRLPLNLFFLDQESELQFTIKYIESVMKRPEIKPFWMQVPFRLFNSSSFFDEWLTCWYPEDEEIWMRPHHPMAITKPKMFFGTDRFAALFSPIQQWIAGGCEDKKDWKRGKNIGVIVGIRANESMNRRITLTSHCGYKDKTWSFHGNPDNPKQSKALNHWRFAPLYDWSDEDIWTAIGKFKWDYNKYYDELYKVGKPIRSMRVSSLIHETSAEHSLMTLQEVEPETYNKLVKRIGGVSTYSKLMEDVRVHELPSVFKDWEEYVYYLIDKVVAEKRQKQYKDMIDRVNSKILKEYPDWKEEFFKNMCPILLANDYWGTKFGNFITTFERKYNIASGKYDRAIKANIERVKNNAKN